MSSVTVNNVTRTVTVSSSGTQGRSGLSFLGVYDGIPPDNYGSEGDSVVNSQDGTMYTKGPSQWGSTGYELGSSDRSRAWAESDTSPDPDDPTAKSAKTWALETAVSAEAVAIVAIQVADDADRAESAVALAGTYATLALATAAIGSYTDGQSVEITGDGANNGRWTRVSGAWVKTSSNTFQILSDAVDDVATVSGLLFDREATRKYVGVSTTPASAPNNSSSGTMVANDPMPGRGILRRWEIYAQVSVSAITLGAYTKSGDDFTRIAVIKATALAAGYNDFTLNYEFDAGVYLGLQSATGGWVATTNANTWAGYYFSSATSGDTFTDTTASPGAEPQFRLTADYIGDESTADAISLISDLQDSDFVSGGLAKAAIGRTVESGYRRAISGFDDTPSPISFPDGYGNLLLSFDPSSGELIAKLPADKVPRRAAAPNFDDDDDIRVLDPEGRVVWSYSAYGAATAALAPVQAGALRISTGDIVIADADGERSIDGGAYTFLAAAPAGAGITATWDKPTVGSVSRVRFTIDGSAFVPDHPDAMLILGVIGQSLAAGSNAYVNMLANPYPDTIWMGDVGGLSDIRLGQAPSDNLSLAFDPDTLVGLRPAIFRPAAQSSQGYGQTPADSLAVGLTTFCREDMGFAPKLLPVSFGEGGFAYSQLKKGTQAHTNMVLALTKLCALAAARGWTPYIPALVVRHGETDAASTTYAADLLEWWTDINDDRPSFITQTADIPLLLAQPSSFANGQDKAVLAMFAAWQSNPTKLILSHPSYMLNAASDYIHLTAAGEIVDGEYWMKSLLATMGPVAWQPLYMTAAVRSSVTIDVTFHVPVPPIVIDTTSVTERAGTAKGFVFTDDSGSPPTITNVAVLNATTLRLTLSGAPTGTAPSQKLRYALLGHIATSPRDASERPRGNVCDSDIWVGPVTGVSRPNWAVVQQITVS